MKYLLISIAFFLAFYLNAQTPDYSIIDSKRDHNWIMGLPGNIPTEDTIYKRGIHMHFNDEELSEISNPELEEASFNRTNAVISDENGNFLLAFDGHNILDSDYTLAINGTGINPFGQGNWWYWEEGYNLSQGSLILPDFNDPSLYHLFHLQFEGDETIAAPEEQAFSNAFLHTQIKKESLSSKAEVLSKNVPILEGHLMSGKLTAVRHANGRDWWIPVFYLHKDYYRQYLFTPEGLIDYGLYYTELPVLQGLGQAHFSPDGSRYIHHNGYSVYDSIIVDIFDFDRCTGVLSNQKNMVYETPNNLAWGVSVSPNSRYAYLSQGYFILQLDLESENPFMDMDTVGVFDGFQDPFSVNFFAGQLAPDGKIYLCAANGAYYLHVIHNPNEKGASCNFEQRGIELPTGNNPSIPNLPNFRLGRLEGSDCDTLYSSNTSIYDIEPTFSIFPNPARDILEVSWEAEGFQNMDIRVLDMLGREVIFSKGNGSGLSLDVSVWAEGMYLLQMEYEGQVLAVEKVVVQR